MKSELEQLNNVESEIGKAKSERDRGEGIISNLTERLLKEHGFNSIKEAEDFLEESEKILQAKKISFSTEFSSLKEDFVWK